MIDKYNASLRYQFSLGRTGTHVWGTSNLAGVIGIPDCVRGQPLATQFGEHVQAHRGRFTIEAALLRGARYLRFTTSVSDVDTCNFYVEHVPPRVQAQVLQKSEKPVPFVFLSSFYRCQIQVFKVFICFLSNFCCCCCFVFPITNRPIPKSPGFVQIRNTSG